MRILGVDPGTRITGYAIIDAKQNISVINMGELNLSKEDTLPKKIMKFFLFFKELIDRYNIDILAIETPFMSKNAKTFLRLANLNGILHLLGHECTILEFSPPEVKKMISGRGNITKKELATYVAQSVPEAKGKSTDVTDAIAIALSVVVMFETS